MKYRYCQDLSEAVEMWFMGTTLHGLPTGIKRFKIGLQPGQSDS